MFFPVKSKIFNTLSDQTLKIKEAVDAFDDLVNNFSDIKSKAERLKRIEGEGDALVHAAKLDIEKAFMLPIDKEDIQQLIEYFDNIIDNLEQAANRIYIYNIPETDDVLKGFCKLIAKAAEEIHKSMDLVRSRRQNSEDFVLSFQQLHTLENEGDRLHRRALEKLMNNDSIACNLANFLLVIKIKEIYNVLEDTLDECENVANLFEGIRIKYQ